MSAKADKGRMHILGYGIDLNNQALNKKMIDLKDNNIKIKKLSLLDNLH